MTIRELAALAGVSPATVSFVFNGKKGVSESTRNRILELARENGYDGFNRTAAKSDEIVFVKYRKHGMLVEENQGFISTIMDAIEETCRNQKHKFSVVQISGSFEESIKQINFSDYCGAIILTTEAEHSDFSCLSSITIPYVTVDSPTDNIACNTVNSNNFENVYLALKCCKDHGFNEIGHLQSSVETLNFSERREAFLKYTKELNMKFSSKNEFKLKPTLMGAYQDMKNYLAQDISFPACFFSDNDTIAIGAIKALKSAGYHIPADISFIGIDDIPFAAINSPSLSTIRVPKELIGKAAVHLLFNSIGSSNVQCTKIYITGQLIIRSTMREYTG